MNGKHNKAYITYECKCRFDERQDNPGQWWNNDKFRCECKKRNVCEKDYAWNPDEVIESYEEDAEAKLTDETTFNAEIEVRKTQISILCLLFY